MVLQRYRDNGPYTWPGGYPVYALMDDSESMCFECTCGNDEVHEGGEADGWRVEDLYINYEDEDLYCAHCNKHLESAYGS